MQWWNDLFLFGSLGISSWFTITSILSYAYFTVRKLLTRQDDKIGQQYQAAAFQKQCDLRAPFLLDFFNFLKKYKWYKDSQYLILKLW